MVDIPLDAGAGMGGVECLHNFDGPAELVGAIVSAAGRHYGTAGRTWLEWLAPQFDTLGTRIATMLEKHRAAIVPEAASEQVRRVGGPLRSGGHGRRAGDRGRHCSLAGWSLAGRGAGLLQCLAGRPWASGQRGGCIDGPSGARLA